MRAALFAGENRLVEFLRQLRVGRQDDCSARPVQRLVGGGCDHVGVAYGRGHDARRHQPADVRNVGQQVRADFVRNLAELRPIRDPGIGRVPGDDHFRPGLERLLADFFVIQAFVLVHLVMDDFVVFARTVGRRTVRKVTAVQQGESHDGIAGRDQRMIDGIVGGSAGERLHVDENLVGADAVGGESLGAAAARQRFDGVRVFDALVMARIGIAPVMRQAARVIENFLVGHQARLFVRVALGVDVLEGRAHGFAHGQRGLAFGCDQDQLAGLALGFELGQLINVGIKVGKAAAEEEVRHGDAPGGCHASYIACNVRGMDA